MSTFECPRRMPWSCTAGLVENDKRAPAKCKGNLQNCQVFKSCLMLPKPDIISLFLQTGLSSLCSFQSLQQIVYSSPFSYKSCLPKSHRHDIQKRNALNRYRIRASLKDYLKKVGNCSVDVCSLKIKYLLELGDIEPSLGSETFKVIPSSSHSKSAVSLLRVTGGTGIQTSGSCDSDSTLVRTGSRLSFL